MKSQHRASEFTLLWRPGLVDYPETIGQLRSELNDAGYDADPRDIEWAWEYVSSDYAASFLIVSDDDETELGTPAKRVRAMLDHLKPKSEDDEVPTPSE